MIIGDGSLTLETHKERRYARKGAHVLGERATEETIRTLSRAAFRNVYIAASNDTPGEAFPTPDHGYDMNITLIGADASVVMSGLEKLSHLSAPQGALMGVRPGAAADMIRGAHVVQTGQAA